MNKIIARFYSSMIEGMHILFVAGLVMVAIYFWNNDSGYSVFHVGIMILGAIVGWVVIFGFITTVVVISNTLQEIHRQNEIMSIFLKKIAVSFDANNREPVAPTRPSEPFIGQQ